MSNQYFKYVSISKHAGIISIYNNVRHIIYFTIKNVTDDDLNDVISNIHSSMFYFRHYIQKKVAFTVVKL